MIGVYTDRLEEGRLPGVQHRLGYRDCMSVSEWASTECRQYTKPSESHNKYTSFATNLHEMVRGAERRAGPTASTVVNGVFSAVRTPRYLDDTEALNGVDVRATALRGHKYLRDEYMVRGVGGGTTHRP